MIIDAHNHISTSGYALNAEMLIEHMDNPVMGNDGRIKVQCSVSQGAMPQNPTQQFDYETQLAYLLGSIKKYPDRLVGMMAINPWYKVDEALVVLDKLRNRGIKALKFHTKLHNFRPDDDINLIAPVMERATKLRIPVHFHTGDPFAEPARIEVVAERYPDAIIIMCHMAAQMLVYTPDAVGVCKRREKVFLETGFHERRLKEAVKVLGPEKIIFASDCPINDIWSGITMIKALRLPEPIGIGLDDEGVDKILGGNTKKMIGL